MNSDEDTNKNRRIPSRAAELSLILPGLGQLYCGRLLKALVLMACGTLLLAIGMFALLVSMSGPSVAFFLIMVGASVAVWIYAIVDAWITAKRIGDDYALKEYNSWPVYVLLLLAVGIGGQLGYAYLVREKFVTAYKIPNRSMEPTLAAGDRVLALKGVHLRRDPRRGEVVIFASPENRRQTYVKRLVGMPGETVEIRDGELLINGNPVKRGETESDGEVMEKNGDVSYRVTRETGENFGPVTVPDHHGFLLGDNRAKSKDSRHFGPIAFGAMRGRMAHIYWPPSRMGEIR